MNKSETVDEYFTRGTAVKSQQEIEELKNSIKQMEKVKQAIFVEFHHKIAELENSNKQMRQTFIARITRLENRINLLENVTLPDFKSADEELEEE